MTKRTYGYVQPEDLHLLLAALQAYKLEIVQMTAPKGWKDGQLRQIATIKADIREEISR